MKTVRDACQLQPNALSVKLSDQIEQLDELITAEGDGTAYFDKTHITQGMQDFITEGIGVGDAFDSANIAAFNGRNSPIHYFWGEIANQLGK